MSAILFVIVVAEYITYFPEAFDVRDKRQQHLAGHLLTMNRTGSVKKKGKVICMF